MDHSGKLIYYTIYLYLCIWTLNFTFIIIQVQQVQLVNYTLLGSVSSSTRDSTLVIMSNLSNDLCKNYINRDTHVWINMIE